jgi:hypothetical protein
MTDNDRAAREWNRALDRLAAEVTNTAYAIALRHRTCSSWVDLELNLWKALARTVRSWGVVSTASESSELIPIVVATIALMLARSCTKKASKR